MVYTPHTFVSSWTLDKYDIGLSSRSSHSFNLKPMSDQFKSGT